MSFSICFAYEVAPDTRAEFEVVYGPDGQWAEFFRTGDGYVETTLERRGEGEYLVADHWRSRASYERFLARNAARYEALSSANARLYLDERRLTSTGETAGGP
jgi:heme-degrading monooxygenase HmoA